MGEKSLLEVYRKDDWCFQHNSFPSWHLLRTRAYQGGNTNINTIIIELTSYLVTGFGLEIFFLDFGKTLYNAQWDCLSNTE